MTDRGVSTVLGYVLSLAIMTILITGLLATGSSLVADQTEKVVRSELRVIGNQIAADLTTVDRLALSGDEVNVRLTRDLPASVAGTSYRINVSRPGGDGPVEIRLTSNDPEVDVTVTVNNETAVAERTVSGGKIVVRYDGDAVVIDRA
ncbi:MAG: hypothetical protein ABEJ85_04350 [Haloarculaceae archaeon]